MSGDRKRPICHRCGVEEVPDTAFFVLLCDPCLLIRLAEQKAREIVE